MKIIFALNVSILLGFVMCCDPLDDAEWIAFKTTYGRDFKNRTEELQRLAIFKENSRYIADHNERYSRGEETCTLKINRLADIVTQDEVGQDFVDDCKHDEMPPMPNTTVPEVVNWVEKGAVTNVSDQIVNECGACWVFSAVEALESQYFFKTGNLTKFSKQQLLDCVTQNNSRGCRGGNICASFNYLISTGVEYESDYPYEGKDGECRYNSSKAVVKIQDYFHFLLQEDEVKQIVANIGPVATSLDVRSKAYSFYQDGMYSVPSCDPKKRGHTMLIVGYGTDNGVDYWYLKNTLGTDWGINGYMKIARNQNNLCGVAIDTYVPKLA